MPLPAPFSDAARCPLGCGGKRCELHAIGDDRLSQSCGLYLPATRWACAECPLGLVAILPTWEPARSEWVKP